MLALLSRLNDRLAAKSVLPACEERAVSAPKNALSALTSFMLVLAVSGVASSTHLL